jgi:hypothetical protein
MWGSVTSDATRAGIVQPITPAAGPSGRRIPRIYRFTPLLALACLTLTTPADRFARALWGLPASSFQHRGIHMTTYQDMLYQLGGLPLLPLPPIAPGGTWFWVDPVDGSTGNDGLSPIADNAGHGPLATVGAAYAKCTTDKHDVVALIEGDTASNETAAITWSKDYTHLLGFCSPVRGGQRARITAGADGLSPFLTVSGKGCIFSNVRLWQGRNDATSLILASVTGSRNYFHNVDFAGGGHTAQAINGGMSLQISGGEENVFDRCTIGIDTVAGGTGFCCLSFAATGGAARNVFRDCLFNAYAGHAGQIFVEALGNSGLDRYQLFDRCTFQSLSGTAMTEAFAIAAGFDPANKRILLRDCAMIGATDWESNDRGILYLNNGTITGGGNAGLFAVSAAT